MPVNIKILNSTNIAPDVNELIQLINQPSAAAPSEVTSVDIRKEFDILVNDTKFSSTIVHYAAMQSLPYLKYFVEDLGIGVDFSTKNKDGLLHYATLSSNSKTVKFLLAEHHASTTVGNRKGEEPIHYAAMNGSEEVIDYLLQYHPVLAKGNNLGETPLHLAARHGNLAAIKAFKIGNNVNQGTKASLTPLHIAAEYNQTAAIHLLIKELGAEVNQGAKNGYLPLHIAALKGHTASVTKLIEGGANVDQGTGSEDNQIANFTAAHFAAYGNQPEIIAILKQKHANLEQKSQQGYSPLHVAAITASEATVQALLQQRVKVDEADSNWDTALFFAAGKGKIDFSKIESLFKVFGLELRPIPLENAYQAVVQSLLLHSKEPVCLKYNDIHHRQSAAQYAEQVGFTKITQILSNYELFCNPEFRSQHSKVLEIMKSDDSKKFFESFVKMQCEHFSTKQLATYFAGLRVNLANIDDDERTAAFEYNKFVNKLKDINSAVQNDGPTVEYVEAPADYLASLASDPQAASPPMDETGGMSPMVQLAGETE